jgi:hypothetical protein
MRITREHDFGLGTEEEEEEEEGGEGGGRGKCIE